MKKILFILLLVCATFLPIRAQETCPQSSSCMPSTAFSFGEAKAHLHGWSYSVTGFYCGRWLRNDPTNNPSNQFFGNEICVISMTDFAPHWYWYDWSQDSNATSEQSVWRSNYPYQWVTVNVADSDCLLATQAYNPWTGGV